VVIGGLRITEAVKKLSQASRNRLRLNQSTESFDLAGAAKFLGRSQRWLRDNCTSLGIGHERVGPQIPLHPASWNAIWPVTGGRVKRVYEAWRNQFLQKYCGSFFQREQSFLSLKPSSPVN
jgi:hypothetical protein